MNEKKGSGGSGLLSLYFQQNLTYAGASGMAATTTAALIFFPMDTVKNRCVLSYFRFLFLPVRPTMYPVKRTSLSYHLDCKSRPRRPAQSKRCGAPSRPSSEQKGSDPYTAASPRALRTSSLHPSSRSPSMKSSAAWYVQESSP